MCLSAASPPVPPTWPTNTLPPLLPQGWRTAFPARDTASHPCCQGRVSSGVVLPPDKGQ